MDVRRLTSARDRNDDDEFTRLHLLEAERDGHGQHGDRGEGFEPAK